MQIRSISSFNLDEKKIVFHFNKDITGAITQEKVIARSRLQQFKRHRQKFYPEQTDHRDCSAKAYKFIFKKKRLTQPTIITDQAGDLHYLFPDLTKKMVYHFCITEPSLEQLLKEKQSLFKDLQIRYNRNQQKTHPTVFNGILAIHERLKHQIVLRAKRKNGLELDFAHALLVPIQQYISKDNDMPMDKLLEELQRMLQFHDEYTPPDEETLERSLQQLEERKAAHELASGLTHVLAQKEELWKQIEAMTKSGETISEPDKFNQLVAQFDELTQRQEQIESGKVAPEVMQEVMACNLTELYERLDELNDVIENSIKHAGKVTDQEAFDQLVAERQALMQNIADEKQRILIRAEEEEREKQRLAELAAEQEKKRQEDEQKLQLESNNAILAEPAERPGKVLVHNLFGSQNNFFKPKKTFWQKVCDFFRSLFCCFRPQVDDEEQCSPRMSR